MFALKNSSQSAKNTIKIVAYLLFIIAYASALSIGMECLLNLFGISMGIALDSNTVNQYPRFIPFCVVVGFLALVSLLLIVILNIKVSEKLGYTKKSMVHSVCFGICCFNSDDKALGNAVRVHAKSILIVFVSKLQLLAKKRQLSPAPRRGADSPRAKIPPVLTKELANQKVCAIICK